jgi:hypothetical protein
MNHRRILLDPLQGRTAIGTVIWVYGFLGSLAYSLLGVLFVSAGQTWGRVYTIGGALYTLYVTLATYQCARNCKTALGRRTVRFCAVLTLLLLPLFTYLEWSGALELTSLRGTE